MLIRYQQTGNKNFQTYSNRVYAAWLRKFFPIEVDPSVLPTLWKSRTMAYMLKDNACAELDRLVSEEIINLVSYSHWAAAMVSIVKSNGSLRAYSKRAYVYVRITNWPWIKLLGLIITLYLDSKTYLVSYRKEIYFWSSTWVRHMFNYAYTMIQRNTPL